MGAWQRRIAGRLFATSVAKRALASIRWRAGLDAELNDLRWKVANLERTSESVVAYVNAPLPTRGSLRAYTTPADADLLETLLLRVSARFDDTLHVLEWGSGLSTLHYPDWLRRRRVRVDWTALEHDRALFRERSRLLYGHAVPRSSGLRMSTSSLVRRPPKRGRVIVFDEGSMDDYVGRPATLGRRFHAIIVDGRKRRRCLAEAAFAPGDDADASGSGTGIS